MNGQLELFAASIASASARVVGPAQLDGLACLICGRGDLPMVPVGFFDGGHVFVCEDSLPMVSGADGASLRTVIAETCGVRWTEEL
ncbi:hypothetical protein [Streptomyces sp. SID3343]|uniref:hypothetical protein n=1 Tax=Streptomyces sp. SID3343 TaxID=2690260 RepID=UPI00136C4DE3|nr:hypothetical protein [Streptomyces sp. SID3343]MYW00706.1 hypothetical protein [Streptomyces sp. SID3343]